MVSPVELIARTVGLQHAKPEILAASAEVTQRILGVDSASDCVAAAISRLSCTEYSPLAAARLSSSVNGAL